MRWEPARQPWGRLGKSQQIYVQQSNKSYVGCEAEMLKLTSEGPQDPSLPRQNRLLLRTLMCPQVMRNTPRRENAQLACFPRCHTVPTTPSLPVENRKGRDIPEGRTECAHPEEHLRDIRCHSNWNFTTGQDSLLGLMTELKKIP